MKITDNLLHNQNYIISNTTKVLLVNKFLFFKYLSILSNRVVGTVILVSFFIVLYYLDISYFREVTKIFSFVAGILIIISLGTPVIVLIMFFMSIRGKGALAKCKKRSSKKNDESLLGEILSISSPIMNLKTFFIEERGGKINIIKKIFSGLLLLVIGSGLGLAFSVILDATINVIFLGEFRSSSSDSYISGLFIPFIFISAVVLTYKGLSFLSRVRIINIILSPIVAVIYILHYLYSLIYSCLRYYCVLAKVPYYSKFDGFTRLTLVEAENREILISKINNINKK